MLLLLVTLTWLLWAVGGVVGLWVEIRQGRRPANARFSFAPIFPIFPIFFFGLAMLVNLIVPPWGTRIIGGLHALLALLFIIAIAWTIYRGTSGNPAA